MKEDFFWGNLQSPTLPFKVESTCLGNHRKMYGKLFFFLPRKGLGLNLRLRKPTKKSKEKKVCSYNFEWRNHENPIYCFLLRVFSQLVVL